MTSSEETATRWCIFQTCDHPSLESPVIDSTIFQGPISLSKVIKKLKISGQQACELKRSGKTSWVDENGSIQTIEIRQET